MKENNNAIAGEKTLATQLKELRSRLGLTQAEMAQEMTTTVTTICRWETGKSNPTFDFPMVVKFINLMKQANMDINDFPIK